MAANPVDPVLNVPEDVRQQQNVFVMLIPVSMMRTPLWLLGPVSSLKDVHMGETEDVGINVDVNVDVEDRDMVTGGVKIKMKQKPRAYLLELCPSPRRM